MIRVDSKPREFPLGRGVRLDLLDRDPYPILARLREAESVSWIVALGMWYVTRRADVVAVLDGPETFSVESDESLLADTFGPTMISRDGPEQQRLRQPFNPPFLPAEVRRTTASEIERLAHRLIDSWSASGAVDLVQSFSNRLALGSVFGVLGLPLDDFRQIRAWYDEIAAALANYERLAEARRKGASSVVEFADFIHSHLRGLAQGAADGTLACVYADPDRGLTTSETVANTQLIIFGGLETTAGMLSNTIWALLHHPAQFEQVRRDPDRWLRPAVEEALRWESPVQTCTRHVVRAVEMRGVSMEVGDTVQCMIGAANRDPEHFDNPDAFDISRSNAGHHLAFARGKHFCLRAALARLEGEIGLRALFERLPGLRLDPERPSAPRGHEFRSPPTLHVRW